MNKELHLADEQTAQDLQAYLTRAKRLDKDGLVRLRAFGGILAAYVAPIFAGSLMDSGPTVLGLRTAELGQEAETDVIVPISSVLDRLALMLSGDLRGSKKLLLELPAGSRAPWAGRPECTPTAAKTSG